MTKHPPLGGITCADDGPWVLANYARNLERETNTLRKALRRIAGMAGNPDAAQGCRDILAVVRESGVAE